MEDTQTGDLVEERGVAVVVEDTSSADLVQTEISSYQQEEEEEVVMTAAAVATEEQQTSEEIMNNLVIENEALKQENHELRLRIEQLENLHLSNPEPSPTRPSKASSPPKTEGSKPAPAADSTAKKPELNLTLANLRSMPCLSADVLRFFECFEKYSYDNDSAKAFRRMQWAALDSNGSGHVSLAETMRWIKSALYQMTKNRDEGERLYRLFYPSYIRAFTDAADAGVDKKIKGMSKGTEDDFIQKGEFRLLASYLCIYALMLETFHVLDGSRASPAATATSVFRADKKAKTPPPKQAAGRGSSSAPSIASISGDRRLSQEEWIQRYSTLGATPFVALNTIAQSPELAQAAFGEMDADGKGAVLLAEYCQWLKAKEIAQETSFGRLLSVGDNVK